MPRDRKLLSVKWPDGGLDEQHSYRNQPPYTTPDCLNVRPEGPIEERLRGGTRPGLNKYFYQQISGGSNPIRMLSQVTVVSTDGLTFFTEGFTGNEMSSDWTAASFWGGVLPRVTGSQFNNLSTTTSQAGGVLRALSPVIDTSKSYFIELAILPDPRTGSYAGTYSIFARMNDATPVGTTEGVIATITLGGATQAWTGSLTEYNAGVGTPYAFTAGVSTDPAIPGTLAMLVAGDTVSVFWRGTQLVSQAVTAHAGTRIGFGITSTVASSACVVRMFRAQYYSSDTVERTRTITVASANGELWRETWKDWMAKLTTNLSLASDRTISATERAQKLYIADRGNLKAKGTDGARGTTNSTFDSATYTDWTALGISAYDDVLVISAATGVLINGTYTITTVAAGELTLGDACATGAGVGAASFRIERGPKVFDPVADTLTLWRATGAPAYQVPTGRKAIALFRDRIVMAKDNIWDMSASGDANDWDFSGTDANSAVEGTNSDAGLIGEPIQALQSFSDDYLIFGCRNSTWVMRGDPFFGGKLDSVSRTVGAADVDAITMTNEGLALFITHDGMFGMAPGSERFPEPLSDQVPDRLKKTLSEQTYVAVCFDSNSNGAYIFTTPDGSATTTHYWYDWERRSYWPVELPKAYDPTKIHYRKDHQTTDMVVLLGGRDGYIRFFDPYCYTDDGTSIDSYIKLGPFRPSMDQYFNGKFETMQSTLGETGGSVGWAVYVGDTNEDCIRQTTAIDSGTWSADTKQYSTRVRVRCGSFLIKLSNGSDRQWTMEDLHLVVDKTRQRRPS